MSTTFVPEPQIGDRFFLKNGQEIVHHPLYYVSRNGSSLIGQPAYSYKNNSSGPQQTVPNSEAFVQTNNLLHATQSQHQLQQIDSNGTALSLLRKSASQYLTDGSNVVGNLGYNSHSTLQRTDQLSKSKIDLASRIPQSEYARNFDSRRVTWKGDQLEEGQTIQKNVYPNPNDPLSKFRPLPELLKPGVSFPKPFPQQKVEKQIDLQNEVIAGTTQKSYHLQGYSGYIPRNLDSPLVWNQALGKTSGYMSSMQDDMRYKLYDTDLTSGICFVFRPLQTFEMLCRLCKPKTLASGSKTSDVDNTEN